MAKIKNLYYIEELNNEDYITEIKDDVELEGNLKLKKPVKIDGTLKGDITSESIVLVSKTGKVIGNIEAKMIFIEGEIRGDIIGYEIVSILKTGQLKGDIKTAKLKIADGVIFEGSCSMIK